MDNTSRDIKHTREKFDKWSDCTYHAAQALKELSMAEDHLIAELASNPSDTIKSILRKVRNIRKQIEEEVTG